MNNFILKYSLLFVFLVLLQVLILNNVLFLGFINPLVYILFIFVYPLSRKRSVFLIISFLLGLSIDFFSNSGGSNAAAILFIAYIRLPLLHIIQGKTEFDYLLFTIKQLTFLQATIYIFLISLLHHIILFSLESYKLTELITILRNSFLTSILTSILIGFFILLFAKNKRI